VEGNECNGGGRVGEEKGMEKKEKGEKGNKKKCEILATTLVQTDCVTTPTRAGLRRFTTHVTRRH